MWTICVLYFVPVSSPDSDDYVDYEDFCAPNVDALLEWINRYSRHSAKILSIRRLQYNGQDQDIRLLRFVRPVA